MHMVRGFACAAVAHSGRAPPVLERIQSGHATALKPTHKAGRRGGESIARQTTFTYLFSQPERVAVPRRFARVLIGDAAAFEGVAGF